MIWTVLRHHAMFDQIASYGALWPCTLYTSSQFCMALCGHPHHTHLVNFAWRFVAAHCTHLVNFAWRFVAVHTVRICSILHDALWPPTVRTCSISHGALWPPTVPICSALWPPTVPICSILHDALWPCTPYASGRFCMALCGHPHRTHLVNFAWRFVAAHTVRIWSILLGALWPPTVRTCSILHDALWPCTPYASVQFCMALCGHPHRTHLVNFAWRFVAAHTVRICSVLHGALWPPTVRIWSILHGALWPCTLYASGRFCTLLPGCKQTALNFL